MVQWLHNGDEHNASFYAGLLVSVYAFGEVLTAVLWGYISDRVGRKPVVLFGLCGVAFSSLMFGLAQRYWVALLARLLGGMLNGNVAVMQTMLAEMVKNPEHERVFLFVVCSLDCLLSVPQPSPTRSIPLSGLLVEYLARPWVAIWHSLLITILARSLPTACLRSTLTYYRTLLLLLLLP